MKWGLRDTIRHLAEQLTDEEVELCFQRMREHEERQRRLVAEASARYDQWVIDACAAIIREARATQRHGEDP